jgi:hypothetical protein
MKKVRFPPLLCPRQEKKFLNPNPITTGDGSRQERLCGRGRLWAGKCVRMGGVWAGGRELGARRVSTGGHIRVAAPVLVGLDCLQPV